ncbi:ribonuclease HI family protein [Nocardioides seonyuensis]|uniref:ribonuclease H n=1 Tax=Nocardioides seonyuensis TaxID=2518371 RepID=A0A4P7ICK4_9ACTN|nr:ribonuclease HI family protein [Nocardioides seonyuensis]QBX54829.1 ribonuclease HI family protein [Nocardioides seonyuensis]
MTIIAAADGSALGNPGPAGWGWYVDDARWASGGWAHGTNNMGELMAVLDLLQQSAHLDDDLLVFCDSRYVIDAITKWMPGWKRNGWVKKDRKPVLNVELMKALDEAMQGRRDRVRFEWVKGHAGHELNEAADRLANAAALAFKEGREPEAGPGFAGSTTSHPAAAVGQVVTEPDLFSDLDEEQVPSDEEQVIALERALLTDEVRSDRASVAALLHPQWQEVGASGVLWEREALLERIGPLPSPVTLDVLTVSKPAPDLVLLVWRASTDERTTLRSSLWTRGRGGWQQLFHQGTHEA